MPHDTTSHLPINRRERPADRANLTPQDFEEIGALCAPHDARLKASRKLAMVGSLGMQSRVIRSTGSGSRVEQGPFEPSSCPVGAFFVIEAADDDEALGIVHLHPGAHLGDRFGGGIEIFPIEHLDRP